MTKRAMLLAAVLAAASPLVAQACTLEMGAGWPAGMANYGQAAAQLLGGGEAAGLALLSLPKRGEESQLLLVPADGGHWQVVHAVADRRIHHVASDRSSFGVELRLVQEPGVDSAPLPAALAQRIVGHWQRVLQPALLDGRKPPLMDREDVVSIQVDGQRLSGRLPDCVTVNRLRDLNLLLVELAGSKATKHGKRQEAIARALDKYEERLAAGKI